MPIKQVGPNKRVGVDIQSKFHVKVGPKKQVGCKIWLNLLIEQVGKLEKGEKSSSRVGKIIWHLRVGSNLMTSTAWKHKHRKRYLL